MSIGEFAECRGCGRRLNHQIIGLCAVCTHGDLFDDPKEDE